MKVNINGSPAISDVEQLKKAAEEGDAVSQFQMGAMYEYGRYGVRRDMKEACLWYIKAAEQNYTPAQRALGWLYFLGDGVPQSNAKAEMWVIKAIENTQDEPSREVWESRLQRIRTGKRPRLDNFKRILLRKGWQKRRR